MYFIPKWHFASEHRGNVKPCVCFIGSCEVGRRRKNIWLIPVLAANPSRVMIQQTASQTLDWVSEHILQSLGACTHFECDRVSCPHSAPLVLLSRSVSLSIARRTNMIPDVVLCHARFTSSALSSPISTYLSGPCFWDWLFRVALPSDSPFTEYEHTNSTQMRALLPHREGKVKLFYCVCARAYDCLTRRFAWGEFLAECDRSFPTLPVRTCPNKTWNPITNPCHSAKTKMEFPAPKHNWRLLGLAVGGNEILALRWTHW